MGLGVALFFGGTAKLAYQDAAALMDKATLAPARWKAALVADPYGSTATPRQALPLQPTDLVDEGAVGVRVGDAGRGDVMIMRADADAGADPIHTGTVTRIARTTQVAREGKADLMMSRAAAKASVKVENGLVRRAPRLLLEPEAGPGPQSFLPSYGFQIGRPVQLASLGTAAGLIERPFLETPMEREIRRQRETKEYVRDRQCLATAIYFEARSESERGQEAVAQVVLNRVKDARYPNSVCGVVFQNQQWRNRCQFSFACDGKPERIQDKSSWTLAQTIAENQLLGYTSLPEIGSATHYHATYVNPRWNRYLKRLERIGTHVFYALKPGQR